MNCDSRAEAALDRMFLDGDEPASLAGDIVRVGVLAGWRMMRNEAEEGSDEWTKFS